MIRKVVRSMVLALLLLALLPVPAAQASNDCTGSYISASYSNQTVDSGFGGFWADDDLDSEASIYDLGLGTFCLYVSQTGTFKTWAGTSPSGLGLVGDGVEGTVVGDFSVLVYGASGPASGDQGNYDYDCDHFGVCTNYTSFRDILFTSWTSYTYTWWGWTYTAVCPSNGSWTNAESGSFGDITGEADFTCIIVEATPAAPVGPIQAYGLAKLISMPDTVRIGVDNAFEIVYTSGRGQVCDLRFWGGDLNAPVWAQMVPGSLRYEDERIVARYSLSDLATGATLFDFNGADMLERVRATCHGESGGTAGGVSGITILNHTAP